MNVEEVRNEIIELYRMYKANEIKLKEARKKARKLLIQLNEERDAKRLSLVRPDDILPDEIVYEFF